MKCFNCGCSLSEKDFCTGCGVDVTLYKKIMWMSNMYYNEGLEKANVRDLSGAVVSLKQSLKFNKNNIEARNLLGLVYYEMGEAVSALGEWVISKNLRNKKNIADDYIRMVQSNPTKLEAINQTIKKFNQALAYCYQGSLDLAVIQLKKVMSINPNLVKGYQLLALLYMNNEEWERAKRTLLKAAAIDANNTQTLTYLKETEKMLSEREEPSGGGRKKKASREEVITYQSGNETIIQPVNASESRGVSTVINILIGLVIGILAALFLILPARVQAGKEEINKQLIEVSQQLSVKTADAVELEQRIQALEEEKTALQERVDEYTGTDGSLQAGDYLLQAAKAYMEDPDGVVAVMDLLGNIEQDYLDNTASATFKDVYETIHSDVSRKAAEEYYDSGMKAYKANDFATAITDLTRAFELDETNGDALYNLAQAYRKSENTAKADETYQRVIDLFPDTKLARNARGYLSEADNEEEQAANEENENNSQPPQNQTQPQQDPVVTLPQTPQEALPGIDPNTGLPVPTPDAGIDPLTGLPVQ